jgi:heme/copper-type cytochrome/quinol oxidase subunit 1
MITTEADLLDRAVYNAMFTMNGTIMLFLWTFPSFVGLSNYLVPFMIGARVMATSFGNAGIAPTGAMVPAGSSALFFQNKMQ